MTDFENLTPVQIAAMTQRLVLDPAQVEELVAPDADAGDTIVPRSVKLPASLDRRCKARATELGMNQSAYIRSLIEKDLAGPQARPLTTADLPLILEFIRHAA